MKESDTMDHQFLRKLFDNMEVVQSIEDVDIGPKDIYILRIDRGAIERGHVESYLREFEKLGRKKMRGRVIVSFQGYDSDPREIYQIPEVRKWVARIIKHVPHLFYFLSSEGYDIRLVFFCIANIHSHVGDKTNIQMDGVKEKIEKITKDAVFYSRKVGDPISVQLQLANNIFEKCGYDQLK